VQNNVQFENLKLFVILCVLYNIYDDLSSYNNIFERVYYYYYVKCPGDFWKDTTAAIVSNKRCVTGRRVTKCEMNRQKHYKDCIRSSPHPLRFIIRPTDVQKTPFFWLEEVWKKLLSFWRMDDRRRSKNSMVSQSRGKTYT